jgi:hypothetical protein
VHVAGVSNMSTVPAGVPTTVPSKTLVSLFCGDINFGLFSGRPGAAVTVLVRDFDFLFLTAASGGVMKLHCANSFIVVSAPWSTTSIRCIYVHFLPTLRMFLLLRDTDRAAGRAIH